MYREWEKRLTLKFAGGETYKQVANFIQTAGLKMAKIYMYVHYVSGTVTFKPVVTDSVEHGAWRTAKSQNITATGSQDPIVLKAENTTTDCLEEALGWNFYAASAAEITISLGVAGYEV
jgi:hypothetical protein